MNETVFELKNLLTEFDQFSEKNIENEKDFADFNLLISRTFGIIQSNNTIYKEFLRRADYFNIQECLKLENSLFEQITKIFKLIQTINESKEKKLNSNFLNSIEMYLFHFKKVDSLYNVEYQEFLEIVDIKRYFENLPLKLKQFNLLCSGESTDNYSRIFSKENYYEYKLNDLLDLVKNHTKDIADQSLSTEIETFKTLLNDYQRYITAINLKEFEQFCKFYNYYKVITDKNTIIQGQDFIIGKLSILKHNFKLFKFNTLNVLDFDIINSSKSTINNLIAFSYSNKNKRLKDKQVVVSPKRCKTKADLINAMSEYLLLSRLEVLEHALEYSEGFNLEEFISYKEKNGKKFSNKDARSRYKKSVKEYIWQINKTLKEFYKTDKNFIVPDNDSLLDRENDKSCKRGRPKSSENFIVMNLPSE